MSIWPIFFLCIGLILCDTDTKSDNVNKTDVKTPKSKTVLNADILNNLLKELKIKVSSRKKISEFDLLGFH